MSKLFLITLALFAASCSAQLRDCSGRSSPTFDSWCAESCNNIPAVCPQSLCQCNDNVTVTCRGVGSFGLNFPDAGEWCDSVCNFDPPFCPESLCDCSVPSNTTTFLDIQPNDFTCCDGENRFVFYSEAKGNTSVIYKRSVQNNSVPVECYVFEGGNPTSIQADANNNIWVADPVRGTVSRMSVDCIASSVVDVLSWVIDPIIPLPTALAIIPGEGLLVSGQTNTYFVSFTENGDVFSVEKITGFDDLNFFVRDIQVFDGGVFFISRDAKVVVTVFGFVTFDFIDLHQYNIPDYGGITLNSCGLYFTAPDASQIYFCPDFDPARCTLYCIGGYGMTSDPTFNFTESTQGFDTSINSRCINVNDPFAIRSGCCCDVYVTNPGNGCVLKISNNGVTDGDGPFVPELLHCGLNHPSAVGFYVQPGSPAGCTPVCDPSPPSPIPTVTPSPSRSVTPTPSVTRSPTRSPTPSPSVTPSVSPAVTGRLVPGINLQFSGGFTTAAVATGNIEINLVKCPPGVSLAGLTDVEIADICPNNDPTSIFKIPVSQLTVVNAVNQASRITDFTPFLLPVSANPSQPICLLHSAAIINDGGNVGVCDATCLLNGRGQANPVSCAAISNPIANTRQRARDGASDALAASGTPGTVTTTQIPDSQFQSASSIICDGDVQIEFSINLMASPSNSQVRLNVVNQPRFDSTDRCNLAASQAQRLCYNTAQNQGVHGLFGDSNNLVCVNEFLFAGAFTGAVFSSFDTAFPLRNGDIIDQAFNVQGRSSGCISTMSSAPFNKLCFGQGTAGTVVDSRLCLRREC